MLKTYVVAIAAFSLVTALLQMPATAQHWQGYHHGTHHHTTHDHLADHYPGQQYAGQQYAGDHLYPQQYSSHVQAPIAHGYAAMPLGQVLGGPSVYCPDDASCPLQYRQSVVVGSPLPIPGNQPMSYHRSPLQQQFPNAAADSAYVHGYDHGHSHGAKDGHDHGGHGFGEQVFGDHSHGDDSHGDHSHDGHSRGPVNQIQEGAANDHGARDRQPMTAPALPNRNLLPDRNAVPIRPRFDAPDNRQATPMAPSTDDGPIIMDGPPPSLTSIDHPASAIG